MHMNKIGRAMIRMLKKSRKPISKPWRIGPAQAYYDYVLVAGFPNLARLLVPQNNAKLLGGFKMKQEGWFLYICAQSGVRNDASDRL